MGPLGPCQGTVTDLLERGRHARQSLLTPEIHGVWNCIGAFLTLWQTQTAARKDPNQAWDDTTLKTPRSACPGGLDLAFVLLLDSWPQAHGTASLSFR
jgi:hypothetical protein